MWEYTKSMESIYKINKSKGKIIIIIIMKESFAISKVLINVCSQWNTMIWFHCFNEKYVSAATHLKYDSWWLSEV